MRTLRVSSKRLGLLTLAIPIASILVGCGGAAAPDDAVPLSMLPDYVLTAPDRVREAYQFAAAHPEALTHQPCYCGCGAMGHTSNLSCYVQEVAADGTVIFDDHAAGCGICVDITQDVMRLWAEGWSPARIRDYVDSRYSPFGPSTDTAYPAES